MIHDIGGCCKNQQTRLESLSKLAENNQKETLYLKHAAIQLIATLRNAGIINKELRQAYLESLKERQEFSKQCVFSRLPGEDGKGVAESLR